MSSSLKGNFIFFQKKQPFRGGQRVKTQNYFAAPFLLHRKLHSLSSSSPKIIVTCNTFSFFFLLSTPISLHVSLNFFLSFFLTPAAPFFSSSYFPSRNSTWTQRKKKKKSKSGEDEEVWRGLAKPMLWSPSPTLGWYRHQTHGFADPHSTARAHIRSATSFTDPHSTTSPTRNIADLRSRKIIVKKKTKQFLKNTKKPMG